jgi:hypothetical protein
MRAATHVLSLATLAWGLAATRPAHAVTIPDAASPSLIVGSNGLGMFAFYDRVNGDLMVGRCLNSACSDATYSVIDSAGDVGRYASITPGTSATLGPVISYEDTTNHRLKLALCVDPACAAATTVVIAADIGAGHGSGVVLGTDGRPLVGYLRRLESDGPGGVWAAHCENSDCSSITTTFLSVALYDRGIGVGLGGDGLGVIAVTRSSVLGGTSVGLLRCANQACTTVAAAPPGDSSSFGGTNFTEQSFPALAIGPDGLVTLAGAHRVLIGGLPTPQVFLGRCASPTCESGTTTLIPATAYEPLAVVVGLDNLVRLAVRQETGPGLDFVRCQDAACTTRIRGCLTGIGRSPSLALGSGNQPLAAWEFADDIAVIPPDATCGPVVAISDGSVTEGDDGNPVLSFVVQLGPATTAPLTMSYHTQDGTAHAGVDYVAVSGTLTFAPGTTEATLQVPVIPDQLVEATESFSMLLGGSMGALLIDGLGRGRIVDDDTLPVVDIGDCAVIEGHDSTTGCVLEASLSKPYPEPVSVAYATADGTATAGADYVSQSGVLTFAPGTVSLPVSVSVLGDPRVEPDELFAVLLSNPANATLGDATGDATIVDDDGLTAGDRELSHGATITADLAAGPGPSSDLDDYRLLQAPFASYEVILDAVSGDATPGVRLDRIASDGFTVLQAAVPVGIGAARTLRFQNRLGVPVAGHSIRVGSASCGTGCGADDIYRLRAYETTGSIPRFNNSSTQVTVLLLQNPTADAIEAGVDFWDAAGVRRATHAATVPAHGLLVLNTATLPALAGTSGSITVTHDGGYGTLAGKAVALEPATGFSFDSPLGYKAR